ncbi:MAG TPA: NAD(+) kinase [Steroidobacteraceae bacterium]|nr:NAD(+) kinase [Steroidobacteraceae bacterium]
MLKRPPLVQRMKTPFNSIALVGRHTDERVADSMRLLARHLLRRGLAVLVDEHIDGQIFPEGVTRVPESEFAAQARLVIAIGGDGTMLYAARLVARHDVPLLGVNRGRLGFLTDVSPDDMLTRLDEVLSGKYAEDRRTLLEARLVRVGREDVMLTALNDVVLQKWETGRMLDFETWIDGRYVNTHGGDGLVVATATGSTAYALSCGGPIVQPDLGVLVLVPICPHTLSDRPVVVPSGARIEVRLSERPDTRAQVTCDGEVLGELEPGDRLKVIPSTHGVTLLHPPGHDYYRLLRSKLHWGRGSYDGSAPGDALPPPER